MTERARPLPPPPATGRTFGLPSHEERNLAVPVSAVDGVAYIPADTARKQVEEAEDILKVQHDKFAKDLKKLKSEAEKAVAITKEHYIKQIDYTRETARNAIAEMETQKQELAAEVSAVSQEMLSQESHYEAKLDEVRS